MLKRLSLTNFTVFERATFDFGPMLNVVHGVNGSGKSHVLKLAYCLQHALCNPPATDAANAPTKSVLQREVARELVEVFRPDTLGRLATRMQGKAACTVGAEFDGEIGRMGFRFSTASRSEVQFDETPTTWLVRPPIFLPTREALTLYPGFVSLYDTHAIEFDRTWRDLCVLLGAPIARGPKAEHIRRLLKPIETVMGGKIVLDGVGRFYLKDEHGEIEMHLLAEGLRKLAMLARLVATGNLTDKTCLIWDEPETNLNPKLIAEIARVLVNLTRQGVQIIIATHSLFFIRELLLESSGLPPGGVRYFGLQRGEKGSVSVESGTSIEDSGDLTALDESLAQSERYRRVDH